MYNKELVLNIFQQIKEATEKVLLRFEQIESIDDFTNSNVGMEKLDAICMQLIAIGESLKNIDKITNNTLLTNYSDIDWKGVKGLRDIISHHYFDVDAEQIYWVCDKNIPQLKRTIVQIIDDLESKI